MAVLSPSLQVTSEFADDDARRAAARERFADFGARASICALFVFFATQIGGEFARTGHVTGLLLLVSELLVVQRGGTELALGVYMMPAHSVPKGIGPVPVTVAPPGALGASGLRPL